MTPEFDSQFDYVVVGGGAAGCVVAARLAEDDRASVCLVEAGPSDEGVEAILNLSDWTELLGSEYDYGYEMAPQERIPSGMPLSRGRVLGGTGSINSCVAWRLPDRDLSRWEGLGAAGWGPSAMRGYLDRALATTGIEASGPGSALAQAYAAAAVAAGFPERSWNGDAEDEGVGFASFLKRGQERRSSSVSYLHPLASGPSNLELRLNTRTRSIVFDDESNAVGIETDHGRISARREVIVSCGAYDSPKLLLLSGVGPAAELGEARRQPSRRSSGRPPPD